MELEAEAKGFSIVENSGSDTMLIRNCINPTCINQYVVTYIGYNN
jgi:hypothetical protein